MEDNELADYFNEAAEVRQQDELESPGISAAHEHDPDGLDGTALGDAPLATREFNQAANDPDDREFEAEQPEYEHAPAPELDGPTPPASTGRAQDELTFDEKQQNLDESTGNDDLYEQWYDDMQSGQEDPDNANLNNGNTNEGPDDDIDHDRD